MPSIPLRSGTIHYEKGGATDGRPVVFVHGYAMGASLWRPVSERLGAKGLSCIAPTWPLGAHREPMPEDAELTMEGIAAIIGDFLDVLELDDVIVVGNDTGGAISQILATTRPERLGGLVLTSCDAFEHFPPPILKPLIAAAKLGLAFDAAVQPLRTKLGRKQAFGALAHADIDDLVKDWLEPTLTDRRVRHDLRRFTASMKQESTREAATRLPGFTKPALVAWSADDAFFPLEDGRRLAETLPGARLEVIEQARTFSMIDQPERLAELIGEFAGVEAAERVA